MIDDSVPWDSQWREVPHFPGYYLSQHGQVFSMKRQVLLAPYLNQHGVRSVRMYHTLTVDGARGHSRSVAKLLRETWGL